MAIIPELVHEVHGSVMKAYRSCRWKYSWQYVDGFVPPVKPAPLEFGTAFHIGMETLFNPQTWDLPLKDLYHLAVEAFTAECRRQADEYAYNLGAYNLEPDEAIDYEARIKLGTSMLRKVASDMNRVLPKIGMIRKLYTPITVEEEAYAYVIDPATGERLLCRCHECFLKSRLHPSQLRTWPGLPVVYAIRVDAVLQSADGGYWVVDWKTRSTLLRDQLILELDGQLATYGWVLKDLDIRGFMQVQFLKDWPKRPKELMVPRLGRKFSIAKNVRTDFLTYAKVVSKKDPEAFVEGLYDEHIAWLRDYGPEFTRWFKVYKTPDQLEEVGHNLALQVKEMLTGNPDMYPNPGEMLCSRCWFQEPCLERMSAQDYGWILSTQFNRERPYYIIQRELRSKAGT